MGLFSKKPKELDFDPVDCAKKKERMREMFNEAVEDGDSYRLLKGTTTTSKYETGIWMNTRTTTFYFYIVGYRRSDNQVVLVQIDRELAEHSEAFYVDMDAIVDVYYEPRTQQPCLVYRKNYGEYGELFQLSDSGRTSMYGITNISQKEEREDFLDFLEEFRNILAQKGYKLSKWKR